MNKWNRRPRSSQPALSLSSPLSRAGSNRYKLGPPPSPAAATPKGTGGVRSTEMLLVGRTGSSPSAAAATAAAAALVGAVCFAAAAANAEYPQGRGKKKLKNKDFFKKEAVSLQTAFSKGFLLCLFLIRRLQRHFMALVIGESN